MNARAHHQLATSRTKPLATHSAFYLPISLAVLFLSDPEVFLNEKKRTANGRGVNILEEFTFHENFDFTIYYHSRGSFRLPETLSRIMELGFRFIQDQCRHT